MKKFILVFFFLVITFLVPLFLVNFEKIECVGDNGFSCTPEISALLNQFAGKKFFNIYFNRKKISSLPGVLNYNLVFFPFAGRARFNLNENRPFIAAALSPNSFLLVSKNGVVIQKTDKKPNLPIAAVEDFNYKVSDKVPEDLLLSLEAFSYIHNLYKIEKGTVFKDRIEVYVKNGPILILPREDYKKILGRVRFLVDSIIASPQKFKLDKSITYITIDLRYKNPVLR